MDFSELTNDQLADAAKALLTEMHARHEALSTGPFKTRSGRLLRVAHGALEALKEHCVDEEVISPFSGGEPKGP
jgi:hypothetical protein